MRTVFKFSKGGAARYISHLDLMRTMNRAIRRAGIPAAWSQGYHPHIVMSFAQALGLGYLSEGEYMEISLGETCDLADAARSLNAALPGGIVMTGAWRLDDSFPTMMAAVSAALWRVEINRPADDGMSVKFDSILALDRVEVVKKGKDGPVTMNIRKGIYSIDCNGSTAELFLAAGSALNIRPELVVKAALGDDVPVRSITRLELYTCVDGRHLPFHKICINGDLNECGKDNIG